MNTVTEQPQHLSALENANRIRLARSDLKKDIRTGVTTAGEVLLAETPDWLERMRVGELVQAHFRLGRRRCLTLLAQVPVSENQLVGYMTVRQRGYLALLLTDWLGRQERTAA